MGRAARRRRKRALPEQALAGRAQPHHRFSLAELLGQIDGLEETVARFDAEVARACLAHDRGAVVALLDTIPGIGRETPELLVAEIGTK